MNVLLNYIHIQRIFLGFTLFVILFVPQGECDTVEFVLLHTNDFHSRFEHADAVLETVQALRKQYPHSLLLDAGDMFDSDVPSVIQSKGEVIVTFMNQAGYDGMTVGDNAFQRFHVSQMIECFDRFHFPVLSANLTLEDGGEPLCLPYWIYTVNGIQIGVIGVYNEESLAHAGLKILDANYLIRHYLARLKNRVDCLVVLSHEGISKDRKLAKDVSGIDVIIGGSSHIALQQPEQIGQTILAHAGEHGQFVGVVILRINPETNRVESSSGYLKPAHVEKEKQSID